MRKNIIALSLAAAFLLTGCGDTEQLWKQAQSPDYTFVDSEKEVKDILEKAENKTGAAFSQKMVEELQKLEEALKEPLAKGLISEESDEDEESDYEEDYEDYEEYRGGLQETISVFNENYRKGDFDIASVFGNYTAKNEKDFREALALIEQKGYTGIGDLIQNASTDANNEYTSTMKMIHGIQFSAYHEKNTEPWDFSFWVSEDQLCRTKFIDSFMKANVDDCFTLDQSISGGYIERIKLLGSQNILNENFSNTFIIDTREGKAIRLAVRIQANKKQVSGRVFTEEQEPTVIRLLTQVTGDEKASEEFVKKLELKTNEKGQPAERMKTGKIGNKSYKLQSESVYYDMYYDDVYAAYIMEVR